MQLLDPILGNASVCATGGKKNNTEQSLRGRKIFFFEKKVDISASYGKSTVMPKGDHQSLSHI